MEEDIPLDFEAHGISINKRNLTIDEVSQEDKKGKKSKRCVLLVFCSNGTPLTSRLCIR